MTTRPEEVNPTTGVKVTFNIHVYCFYAAIQLVSRECGLYPTLYPLPTTVPPQCPPLDYWGRQMAHHVTTYTFFTLISMMPTHAPAISRPFTQARVFTPLPPEVAISISPWRHSTLEAAFSGENINKRRSVYMGQTTGTWLKSGRLSCGFKSLFQYLRPTSKFFFPS